MVIKFVVQDAQASVKVEYALLPGVQLPDLFAEGQGVVAEGTRALRCFQGRQDLGEATRSTWRGKWQTS